MGVFAIIAAAVQALAEAGAELASIVIPDASGLTGDAIAMGASTDAVSSAITAGFNSINAAGNMISSASESLAGIDLTGLSATDAASAQAQIAAANEQAFGLTQQSGEIANGLNGVSSYLQAAIQTAQRYIYEAGYVSDVVSSIADAAATALNELAGAIEEYETSGNTGPLIDIYTALSQAANQIANAGAGEAAVVLELANSAIEAAAGEVTDYINYFINAMNDAYIPV